MLAELERVTGVQRSFTPDAHPVDPGAGLTLEMANHPAGGTPDQGGVAGGNPWGLVTVQRKVTGRVAAHRSDVPGEGMRMARVAPIQSPQAHPAGHDLAK